MVQKVLSVADFDSILDNYFGRQISHTPIVKTRSNVTGQETLTEGTTVNIKAHFSRTGQNWNFNKAGFFEKGDAVALCKYADSVSKDDIITVEGIKYRVKEILNVPGIFDSTGSGSSYTYTSVNLFLYE